MPWTEFTQHPDFPLWLLLLGVALAIVAGVLIWRKLRFFRRSQVTSAQVVSFHRRSALEANLWQATVEFTDAQGTKHQLEYTGSDPYPPFAKANNLKVYYDPSNPEKAFAYAFWKVWTAELALSGMALLIILLGVGSLSV